MNTLENKAKFFAQYWGQFIMRVWVSENDNKLFWINRQHFTVGDNVFLELKPLSSISDEDAIELSKIFEEQEPRSEIGKVYITNGWLKSIYQLKVKKTIKANDYLRSKGYALDWNGITVEQQIEFGWIKLKNNE